MSELYELPDGWEWKNISDVLSDIKTGTTPPKKEQKYYDNPSIKWFSPSDFGEHKELVESKNKINEIAIKDKKAKVYQPNSLLLVAIGATVGKIGIVRDESSSNQQITSMNFKDNIYVDFSYYWFVRMKQTIIDTASAATLPIINQNGIKSLPFPLTSLPEQQRIVAKLDTLFEKIDKAMALHQKNIDEANVFMASVLNDVFGELEEKYERKPLGDITDIIGGGTPKRNINEYWENGNIVWLSPTDLGKIGEIGEVSDSKDKITQLGLDKSSAKLLPIGTVLYSSRATIGKISINTIEVSTNQGFANFVCKDDLYNKFLAYSLSKYTDDIVLLSNSTTFKEVSKSNLKTFEVLMPPLSIQQKTVAYLDEISEKIEKVKTIQKEKMESLRALKASILDQAFRGEL